MFGLQCAPLLMRPPHFPGAIRPAWVALGDLLTALAPRLSGHARYSSIHGLRKEMAGSLNEYAHTPDLQQDGDWMQWGGAVTCSGGIFEGLEEELAILHPVDLVEPLVRQGHIAVGHWVSGDEPSTHILLSASDAQRMGIATHDEIVLRSAHREIRGTARIGPIRPGLALCDKAYRLDAVPQTSKVSWRLATLHSGETHP